MILQSTNKWLSERDEKAEIFYKLVQLERERQDKKWPNESRQKNVTSHQWVSILTEEVGEFAKEINDHDDIKAVIELAEVAAVARRIMEVYFSKETLEKAKEIMSDRTFRQQPKE